MTIIPDLFFENSKMTNHESRILPTFAARFQNGYITEEARQEWHRVANASKV